MTFVSCKLIGGLGNQLFQIFATMSIAITTNQAFIFPYSEMLTTGIPRQTYWKTLLDRLINYTTFQTAESDNSYIFSLPHVGERGFEYDELVGIRVNLEKGSLCLHGYFQSYKYFEKQYETITNIIGLREKQESILEKTKIIVKNTVSIHFRLGDYVSKQNYHPVMSVKYYMNALTRIIDELGIDTFRVVYFGEKDDEPTINISIQVLAKKFPYLEFVKADLEEDWEQMLLMSVCSHNIIANSSFSWWGAYFNKNPDKIVCYPAVWFGPAIINHSTKDLCPSSWTRI